MYSAPDEVINELRRTTEAQSRCIVNQQRIIEKLLLKLQENGLSDPLPPGELSTASIQSNSLSDSQNILQLAPNSVPITWTGSNRDLIPISTKGKDSKAMVLTTDMIEKWNVYFNTEVKYNKFIKERDSDEATMKFYFDLCESSETVVEITASGRVFNGHPEARMEIEYNKHRDRANALQEDIDKIADELSDQRLSLHRSMRILFLHNSLRKHDDHQWLQGLTDSKYAIDGYTSYVTLTSESEDSDSETET